MNPASDDVRRRETSTATATMLSAFSASGAVVTTPVVTLSVPLPQGGTLPIAFARTDSNDGTTEQGLHNPFRSNEFFWGYSRRLSEAHSVGVDFRYAQADVQEETLLSPFTLAPTRFETDIVDFTLKVGVRSEFAERWAIGAVGTLFWLTATTEVRNMFTLPNPLAPPPFIAPGQLLAQVDDNIQGQVFRAGIGHTPLETLGVYFDVEYLNVTSDVGGSIDVGRFYLGSEILPSDNWSIYLGVSIDTHAEVVLSGAIGHHYFEELMLQLGFQNNAFPEIKPEFGEFQFVSLSGVLLF